VSDTLRTPPAEDTAVPAGTVGAVRPKRSDERRAWILGEIERHGRMDVAQSALALDVTPETIRKDLNVLERLGRLQRVHGGALPISRIIDEPVISSRTANLDEKLRIAKVAVSELPESGTVFLESSTTVHVLSQVFPSDRPLTIVTNNLFAATTLAPNPAVTVILIGGRIRHVSMTPVDLLAQQSLENMSFDLAFLGTNGFGIEPGLTVPDMSEAAIKQEVLKRSGRRILLADHTKQGQRHLFKYAALEEVDLLITGAELGPELAHDIGEHGVAVHLA
jgi:DeoR family fructose operon transcriptional repressor